MSSVRVTIGTFRDAAEAERVLFRLHQAGIKTFVSGDATSMPSEEARDTEIQVDALDAPEARQVLADVLETGATPHAGEPPSLFGPAEEPPESECSRNARRACRAAVVGFLFAPIELYASWLLLKVITSREELDAKGRQRAWLAVAANVAGYVFAVLLFLSPLFNSYPREANPLLYAHPRQITGIWVHEDGSSELKLWSSGKLHYRDIIEPKCEFTGTWGLGDFQFVFNVRRLTSPGHGYEQGHSYSWNLDFFDEGQIVLHDAHGRWRYVRKRAAVAPGPD
jgi:hypothetical protein